MKQRTEATHKNSTVNLKANGDFSLLEFVWQRGALPQAAATCCHTNSSKAKIASKKYFLHDRFTGKCM